MAWTVSGAGSAEFRGEHSCRVEFQVRDVATGRTRRVRKTCHVERRTRAELERCKLEVRAELERGLIGTARTLTFGEYSRRWLEQRRADPSLAAQTVSKDAVRLKNINLHFGDWRIAEITRADVKRFQLEIMASDEHGAAHTVSGVPLSGTTANGVRKTLRQVLQEAVRDGLIAKNPCDDLPGPSKDTREKEPLSPVEAARFRVVLDGEEPSPTLVAFRLALFAGLRRGEVCALRWRDFDADEGTVTVRRTLCGETHRFKETKTAASRRTVPLDAPTVAYLKSFRDLQGPRLAAHERALWDSCIASRPDRDYMRPAYMTRSLEVFGTQHGFAHVTPHLLRHTYCTLLFAANVDLKTVQYLMGHSDPSTTLGIYTHYLEHNGMQAAGAVASLLDSLPSTGRDGAGGR